MEDSKLSKIAKDPRSGLAIASLALIVAASRGGTVDAELPESIPATISATTSPPPNAGAAKRLDIDTDADVTPGTSITAQAKVDAGARLVEIEGCVGRYDAATRVCVLSPGPWELHTMCGDRASSTGAETVCEVVVRNTGSLPLKFAGYVMAASEDASK